MAAGNKFLAPVGLYQLTDQMISCFKVMEKVTNFIEFSFKSNIWFDNTLDTWIFFLNNWNPYNFQFQHPLLHPTHGSEDNHPNTNHFSPDHIDGIVQDCSNSIAKALELLQYCTKPSYMTQKK